MNIGSVSSITAQPIPADAIVASQELSVPVGLKQYYLEKIRIYYAVMMAVFFYAFVVNSVLIYGANYRILIHSLTKFDMIILIIISSALMGLISLYYSNVKRRVDSIETRKLFLIKIIFQISSACMVPIFYSTFTSAKNMMAHFLQFRWDEPIAQIDKFLHGGIDPWVLYLPVMRVLSFDTIDFIYFHIWIVCAGLLPVLVVLFERDQKFLIRVLVTYAVVWLVLGNLFASMFLSAGPVFYDFVVEGSGRFSQFFAAVDAYGFEETVTRRTQIILWENYLVGGAFFGSGISAFPSVHVGIATLIGLYLWRRLGRFGIVALIFPLAIQIFSVVLGWHYAVDGYFSIVVVSLAWYFSGRWMREPEDRLAAPA